MSVVAPAAIMLGLLAVPIILLYMLRLRRQEQPISSTLLWRNLVRDRAANAPWQKLKRNIFLILQLLILTALVLSLMQPYLRSAGRIDGNLVVLLDASASMTATDMADGASRFDGAIEQVNRLIDDLSGTNQMTLIAVGGVPQVLAAATNDKALLRAAANSAAPENRAADWPAAFALAAGSSQGIAEPRAVIVSDGGLPETLPPLPGEVTYVPIGQRGDNLAISALGIRSAESAQELLVSVANFGPSSNPALLSIYIDAQLYDSRRIELGPAQEDHFSWTLPAGAGVVESRLEPVDGTSDFLAVDDRAWSLSNAQRARRVLLVSDGNLFLERLFAILPGYELVRAADDSDLTLSEDGRPFDLYVFDGAPIPNPLPPGNVLIFDPQPAAEAPDVAPPIRVTGVFTDTTVIRLADDSRLADVDWSQVNIVRASAVDAPGLTALVEAEGGPLLLSGELDGRRVALFPFDLAASDLPLQIAFPVIMANITMWLNPGRAAATNDAIHTGDIVTLIPDLRAESLVVELPDGSTWEQDIGLATAPVLFSDTNQPGIYTVTYRDQSGEEREAGRFDVNFFSREESRIVPVASLSIGQEQVVSDANTVDGRLELWPFFLALSLGLLLLEWWLAYQHGLKGRFLRFR